MESVGCKVTEANANRIECKRARLYSQEVSDTGGEKVTCVLEAQGDQTRVRISTGKGFYGRLGKKNWSSPIYQEMLKVLQAPRPWTGAAGRPDDGSLSSTSEQ